jgi:plasmid stabilization system protein ParE
MAEVVIAAPALKEFADSLQWYAERSVRAAEKFEAEFDRLVEAIGTSPEKFPRLDQRHRYVLMRRYPFQMIYRQHNEVVEVIAVAHTSRRPGYWSDR